MYPYMYAGPANNCWTPEDKNTLMLTLYEWLFSSQLKSYENAYDSILLLSVSKETHI